MQHFGDKREAKKGSGGPKPAAPSGRSRQAERRESQGAPNGATMRVPRTMSPSGFRDRSLPPPVAEAGRRSVGNGKERLRDYAGFPGRQPNVSPYRKKNAVSEQAAQQPTIETVGPRKAYSEHDKRRLLSKEPPFDMHLFEAA